MAETSVNASEAVPARPARMDFERALVLDTVRVTEQAAPASPGAATRTSSTRPAPTPCGGC